MDRDAGAIRLRPEAAKTGRGRTVMLGRQASNLKLPLEFRGLVRAKGDRNPLEKETLVVRLRARLP